MLKIKFVQKFKGKKIKYNYKPPLPADLSWSIHKLEDNWPWGHYLCQLGFCIMTHPYGGGQEPINA